MRLNAWARLGILASLVWMLAAGYARYRDVSETASAQGTAQFQSCSLAVQSRGSGDFGPCLESSRKAGAAAQTEAWTEVAIAALAPPAAIWILILVGAVATRWVLAGQRDS